MADFNPAPGRYTSLQVGRGLAALIVVLHHTVGRAHVAGLGPGLGQGFGFGFLGVDFFFVLSGFIIAYTLSKPGAGVASFLWRRAIRLFPVFWLVFAVSGLAVWIKPSLLGHAIHYSVAELVQAALLIRQDISDGRSNPPIVGVAWTLHHEVLFYAAAALWLWRPRLGLALGAVVLMASVGTPHAYPATYILNPLNLEFAFGLSAFWLHRRLSTRTAAAMVGGGVLLLLLMWQAWPPLDELVNNSRVWSAGLPLALIVCGIAALERLSRLSGARSASEGGGGGSWRGAGDVHAARRLELCPLPAALPRHACVPEIFQSAAASAFASAGADVRRVHGAGSSCLCCGGSSGFRTPGATPIEPAGPVARAVRPAAQAGVPLRRATTTWLQ